MSSGPPLVV